MVSSVSVNKPLTGTEPAMAAQGTSNAASVLLLPAALIAAWYISYANLTAWIPAAFAILAVSAAVSTWQDSRGGKAHASSSGTAALSPDQTLQLIKSRRSVFPKDFSGDNSSITREKLELMLEAARWAPTHQLTEPWHFVVIGGDNKNAFEDMTIRLCQELLPPEKAEQTVAKLQRKKQKDWPKVHCYIALCMMRNDSVPEWEEMCALGCAVQNLALQASSLGIHGYWTSWQVPARESTEMQQLLGLDPSRGDRCLGFFVVGTADAERVAGYRPKRQPLADKVVWKL